MVVYGCPSIRESYRKNKRTSLRFKFLTCSDDDLPAKELIQKIQDKGPMKTEQKQDIRREFYFLPSYQQNKLEEKQVGKVIFLVSLFLVGANQIQDLIRIMVEGEGEGEAGGAGENCLEKRT